MNPGRVDHPQESRKREVEFRCGGYTDDIERAFHPDYDPELVVDFDNARHTELLIVDFSAWFLRVGHLPGSIWSGLCRTVRLLLSGTGSRHVVGMVCVAAEPFRTICRFRSPITKADNAPTLSRTPRPGRASPGAAVPGWFGEGTQRTNALITWWITYVGWLSIATAKDTAAIWDPRRYTASPAPTSPDRWGLLGVQHLSVRTRNRSGPLAREGYYLDLTIREGVNEPLRAALSARRLVTGRDRDRSTLGHLAPPTGGSFVTKPPPFVTEDDGGTTDSITVRLERRAYTPTLRKAELPTDTRIPWLGNKTIRYELR